MMIVRRLLHYWGIRFNLRYIFPIISDDKVREARAFISTHTANSIEVCDRMFVPDFLHLYNEVGEIHKNKQKNLEFLIQNFNNIS